MESSRDHGFSDRNVTIFNSDYFVKLISHSKGEFIIYLLTFSSPVLSWELGVSRHFITRWHLWTTDGHAYSTQL